MVKIKVKELQGDEYDFDIDAEQRVFDLKSLISDKANGLAIERQKLVFKGRTMQDGRLLSDYNVEDGSKVHLIVPRETTPSGPHSSPSKTPTIVPPTLQTSANLTQTDATSPNRHDNMSDIGRESSKFELILRDKLAQYFPAQDVNRIIGNLQKEIDADVNSSSLDDLERLAKQKLKITNE